MTSWGWDVPPEPERWLPTPPMPSRWTFMEACTCPCCAVERAQRRSDQFFAQPANTPTVVRPPTVGRPEPKSTLTQRAGMAVGLLICGSVLWAAAIKVGIAALRWVLS